MKMIISKHGQTLACENPEACNVSKTASRNKKSYGDSPNESLLLSEKLFTSWPHNIRSGFKQLPSKMLLTALQILWFICWVLSQRFYLKLSVLLESTGSTPNTSLGCAVSKQCKISSLKI